MGPSVGTATTTAVMSANRVDLGRFSLRCVPTYTYERRLYLATLYPTRFTLDSLLALTISAQCKTYGYRSTLGVWLARSFLRRKKRCPGVVGTRTDWVLEGEGGGIITPPLQYIARFEGGGEIVGFGEGGYNESWPWCSLSVGFPSIFVAPSGEQLALSEC